MMMGDGEKMEIETREMWWCRNSVRVETAKRTTKSMGF